MGIRVCERGQGEYEGEKDERERGSEREGGGEEEEKEGEEEDYGERRWGAERSTGPEGKANRLNVTVPLTFIFPESSQQTAERWI